MDFRNFFFDFGIIRTVGQESIAVDLAEKSNVFFIPGTNYRWREFITEFEVTENFGQLRTVDVKMVFPLDVGFYVLDVGLLCIASIAVYRFGYISDQPVGFDSTDPLRTDWSAIMISQPRFEVSENVVQIGFSGVSALFFTTGAFQGEVRSIGLTRGIFTVGQFIGWLATNLLGIKDKSKIKFKVRKELLNKDAFDVAKRVRSNHVDSSTIFYDSSKYMSNIEFFRLILADFNMDFVNVGNEEVVIFNIDENFIQQSEKPKVRLKWMGQINTDAKIREIPINSIKVPHHWLFLPRGGGTLIPIERDKATGKFTEQRAREAVSANLDELRRKEFNIELKVRGSLIGRFTIPPGFDDNVVTEYADSYRLNQIKQKKFQDSTVGNLDLEVETVGLPDLHAGDLVEVVGFPSSSTVRSFVRGKKVFVSRFSPSDKPVPVNMITLGGKYRVMQITYSISDAGFINIMRLMRTLPFVPSGEEPTERRIVDSPISFSEILAKEGESLLKKKRREAVTVTAPPIPTLPPAPIEFPRVEIPVR